MARFLPFLISLVLTVYALFSCIQTRDEDVPHLPKLVWIILIVFVPFVGPITWLLMVRSQGLMPQRAPVGGRTAQSPAARPVAPDDDPDFLASLEPFRDPRLAERRGGTAASGSTDPAEPVEDGANADDLPATDKAPKDKAPKDKPSKDKPSKDQTGEGASGDAKSEPDEGPRA